MTPELHVLAELQTRVTSLRTEQKKANSYSMGGQTQTKPGHPCIRQPVVSPPQRSEKSLIISLHAGNRESPCKWTSPSLTYVEQSIHVRRRNKFVFSSRYEHEGEGQRTNLLVIHHVHALNSRHSSSEQTHDNTSFHGICLLICRVSAGVALSCKLLPYELPRLMPANVVAPKSGSTR